jgi:uncharacterized membrane protein YeaQ/YmgE (transglycosylase-associated protein family)
MELGQIIALIIIGALAGSAASSLFKRSKRNNLLVSTIIGVLGAVVGGFLFDAVGINPESGILAASISLGSVVAAFVGAIIVLVVVGLIQR